MPYPRDLVNSFEEKYGKKGKGFAIAYMKKHPGRAKKALRTARKKGHGGIIRSLAKGAKR